MSKRVKIGIASVIVWAVTMLLCVGVLTHWTMTAAARTAPSYAMMMVDAPASSPAVAPAQPEGLIGVVSIIEKAWGTHNWPAIFVAVLMGLLWFERNFKGRTGCRFSRLMGTWWGILLSSLLTSAVTAASAVMFNGWAAIGHAALVAVATGLINAAIQYTGPAAGPAVPTPTSPLVTPPAAK